MEERAERLHRETEELRQAELRARETLEAVQRLAKAIAAAPDPGFKLHWFAVPVPRPLMSEDGSLTAVAELVTGTWYLAVERRGDSLVVQTADGARGILLDTTGIQHGDTAGDGEVAADSGSNAARRRKRKNAQERIQENLHSAEQLADALQAEPEPDFAPFWFAVPVPRALLREDGSSVKPTAELAPGTWYLAVERRGHALVAQTQDGRRGLLLDTVGIQRG